VGTWLLALPQTLKYLFVTGSVLLLFSLALRRVPKDGRPNKAWLLGIPIAVAVVFWFFTAPDPRFLGAIVVLYFAWSLYVVSMSVNYLAYQYLGNVRKTCSAVINIFVMLGMVVFFVRWSLLTVSPLYGWSPLPAPERSIQVNRSGYKAFVPNFGTQCWGSEIPCTLMLDDGLRQKPLSDFAPWLRLQPHRITLSIER
jgi:hypothetical protein